MKAVDIKGGIGNVSSLFINENIPKPIVTENQVLVQVKAFGVNPLDSQQRQGLFPLPLKARGLPMGVEFAGVVVSPGLAEFEYDTIHEGDEVFGLVPGGAYAEYVAAGAHTLFKKPANLAWETCAAIPETWMTAVQALYMIDGFTPGKSILWHAGVSNVSIAGIQMSVFGGASETYVTASSEEKIQFCKGLGATEGFSYQTEDWATSILEATAGKGVDFIVDFVGGPYFEKNLRAIAQDGRIVCISALGGQMIKPNNRDGVDMAPIILKRARIEGSLLRNRDGAYQRCLRDLIVKHALPHIGNGSFKVPVYQSLDW